MIVPNQFPRKISARRLALIAESPGKSEVAWHICPHCGHGYDFGGLCLSCKQAGRHVTLELNPSPFVGPSGKLLNRLLDEVGIDRAACYIGNVAQTRPPGDNIYIYKWNGEEIQRGLVQLRADLAQFQPQMVFCLGGTALRAMRGEAGGIKEWRGSLFTAHPGSPAPGVKCLSTFHPAAILREWGLLGISRFDYRKLAREMGFDEARLPVRRLLVDLSKEELLYRLEEISRDRITTSPDIEGRCDHVSCIGFAYSPLEAFVVPFIHTDGTSWWEESEEVELWEAVAGVLEDPLVSKIYQNGAYEAFVLAWSYGIHLRGTQDDTMLQHWEAYPEFEKRLGFMASHLTDEPYYKFERKKAKEMGVEEERVEEGEETEP